MSTIQHPTLLCQALDAAAIAAADFSLDADQGADLCADLDSRWFDQGRALFLEGQPLSDCWNEMQRAGYRLAEHISSDPIAIEDWPRIERATAWARAAVAQLATVEIDGAEIAIFPWEDAQVVADDLRNVWEEIERRPGMDWMPSQDEIADLLEGDPEYDAWRAEFEATLDQGAPMDFAAAVADVFTGGLVYCPPGIDWAAVEDEPVGM